MSTTDATVSEKPIIFSTDMIQAILDGRKTQTRRVMKLNEHDAHYLAGCETYRYPIDLNELGLKCRYGQPGHELWVRESFTPFIDMDGTHGVQYEDGTTIEADHPRLVKWIQEHEQRRYPSIFMLREASRIQLAITDIGVERVQAITNTAAEAEGCEGYHWNPAGADVSDVGGVGYKPNVTARDSFSYLWDSINADRGYSWESNPCCWCVEFEVKQVWT